MYGSMTLRLRIPIFVIILFFELMTPYTSAWAATIPPEAVLVADFLRRMGRTTTADTFLDDLKTGRTVFGAPEDPTANAETGRWVKNWGKNGIEWNKERFLNEMFRAKKGDYSRVSVINWALTVEHEYIHMKQSSPDNVPKFENPAYYHEMDMGQTWIRKISHEMVEASALPDTPGKAAKLRELGAIMKGLGKAWGDTVVGIEENIKLKKINPKGPWPADFKTSNNFNDVKKKTAEKAREWLKFVEEQAKETDLNVKKEKLRREMATKKNAQIVKAQVDKKEKERRDKENKKKAQLAQAQVNIQSIKKGSVRNKSGEITITETYDNKGNLVKETHTTTDTKGAITVQTVYEGVNGQGRTIKNTNSAVRNAKPLPNGNACATGYVLNPVTGKCASPFDASYTGYSGSLADKGNTRGQKTADQIVGDSTSAQGKRYAPDEVLKEIDEVFVQISRRQTSTVLQATNMGEEINDASLTKPSAKSSKPDSTPLEAQSSSPPEGRVITPSSGPTGNTPTQPPKTKLDPSPRKLTSPPAEGKVVNTPPDDASGDWIRRIEELRSRNDWQGLLKIYSELVAANTRQYQERYITKEPYLQPFQLLSKYLQEFAEKKWDWFKEDVPRYFRKILNSSGDDKALRKVIRQAQQEHPAVMQKMFDNQGSSLKILSLIQEFIVKFKIPAEIRD